MNLFNAQSFCATHSKNNSEIREIVFGSVIFWGYCTRCVMFFYHFWLLPCDESTATTTMYSPSNGPLDLHHRMDHLTKKILRRRPLITINRHPSYSFVFLFFALFAIFITLTLASPASPSSKGMNKFLIFMCFLECTTINISTLKSFLVKYPFPTVSFFVMLSQISYFCNNIQLSFWICQLKVTLRWLHFAWMDHQLDSDSSSVFLPFVFRLMWIDNRQMCSGTIGDSIETGEF